MSSFRFQHGLSRFRFWLNGEKDPEPVKVAQYARWRELRKQHEENIEKHGSQPKKQ